ncbi:MAG: FKBP-type peptidyl-prolyl cis-trans isomerase [Polaribacter sp.]|uniref:FKBP-type peptidyl-prolyl cis-trans isomerase n=1 Tax=Polaribacter sp. TaxID=1920175 RepID=UPI003265395B
MKYYLTLFLSVILFASCTKEEEVSCTPQTEEDIIEYINSNELTTTKTDSGLYYIVDNEGTGKIATENSIVDLKYKAYFLDGTDNSESESTTLNLSSLIPGLSEGIQLFKEGGKGTLIIPHELGFGEAGNSSGSIPCGTVLIFEIEILAVYDNYKEQNEAAILQYIEDNNLTATKTESGLYYVINNEGTGAQPTNTSNVTVAYKGSFLNGTVFDESTVSGATFNLNEVIEGWTEGLQLFKEGGDGILLIPYTLGYGEYGYSSIPGYTVLAFDVKLISVN